MAGRPQQLGDSSDASQVILRLLEETEDVTKKYHRIGALNEQFCSGNQWGAVALNGGPMPTFATDDWSVGLPRIWSNRIAGLLQSWAALLTGDQPTASARPASIEALDAYRSEIANSILQYLRQKLQTNEKISQCVRYAGQHGTSGIKVTYDTEKEELRWDICTIFDYEREPTPDFRDAQWVIFRSWLSVRDAKRRLVSAGFDFEPAEEPRTNSLGEKQKGCELLELYSKPELPDYPEGRYAAVLCGETIQEMGNPYFFDVKGKRTFILPLFLMKVREQRDSPYGATPVTDCVPLQRTLNESIATLMLRMRMGQPSLLLPQELADNYTPLTSAVIAFQPAQAEAAKAVRWTEPPPSNIDLDKLLALVTNEMMAVIGLNDTSAGNAQRAQSGAAIDSLLALDKQKNADTTSSMKSMILDLFKFSLLCVAALYPEEKKAEIAAETNAAIDLFDESDVGGVDVALQLASENDDRSLGEQRGVPQGLARERARQIVSDFLAGADVLVGPDGQPALPPDADATALRAAIDDAKAQALQQGDQESWGALFQLQQHVDELTPAPTDPNAAGKPAGAPAAPPNPDTVNPDAVVDGPPKGA